jgi:hypothetical protein
LLLLLLLLPLPPMLLLLLLCLQFDATKITTKSFAAAISKLLTKPHFAAAAAAAGKELRSRSGPNDTAQLLLQFAEGEATTAAVTQAPSEVAAAAAGEVRQKDAVRGDSAAPAELHVVDSASAAAAAAARDSDVAAVQDNAAAAAAVAAPAGKIPSSQPHQINVAARATTV